MLYSLLYYSFYNVIYMFFFSLYYSFYNVTFNTKMLYICFCMLCICLNVYHFVHIIILIILAHFWYFRLFFSKLQKIIFTVICFTSAIYMFKITIIELFLANIHFGFIFSIIMVNRQYVLDSSVIVISKLSLCF